MLRHFITETLLTEKTRYQKETGRDSAAELRQHLLSLASDAHPAQYAFTMIKIPKVGLNPQTSYDTPAGVYFYPLTKEYCQKLIDNKLPFVSDNPYFGLVKLNGLNEHGKWLKFISRGSSGLTQEDVEEAESLCKTSSVKAARQNGKHWDFNNDAKVFDLTYFETRSAAKPTSAWNRLLRQLGYVGIYDSGHGIVHPSEPTQLVALGPAAYQVVGIWETKELRRVATDDVSGIQNLSAEQKLKILKRKFVQPELLLSLSKDKNRDVRCAIARNSSCPKELLLSLSKDKDWDIRRAVAQNPNCPKELLPSLSKDEDWTIKCAVVRNLNCPKELLLSLSKDEDWHVRSAVVENPNCPEELLLSLSKDYERDVRCAVARNPNCPKELLLSLSKDYERDVRCAVARNLNCHKELLLSLSKDETGDVRCAVAQNPNCPKELLLSLSKDEGWRVKRAVAQNPNCPKELLLSLSKDENKMVVSVAKEMLQKLKK